MEDEAFWLRLWSLVAATIVAIVAISVFASHKYTEQMIAAGMERRQVLGSCCVEWVSKETK